MLVDDVQFVELPELVIRPILVWLDTVDNFKARLPKAYYSGSRYGLVVFGTITDWERRILFVEGNSSGLNQGAGEVIERASQIMNSIPESHGEFGVNFRNTLNLISYASRLRVTLSPNCVGIIASKFGDSAIKILDVLIGPIVFLLERGQEAES